MKSWSLMYLPPVPLKRPMLGRLKVDFRFSLSAKRINGIGASVRERVINYHTPEFVYTSIYINGRGDK